MSVDKKQQEKTKMHTRNKNRDRYDLNALKESNPELVEFVKANKYGDDSIDFSNATAVKVLNKSLLIHYYGIQKWAFPDSNLCPPIPGRADYIHYIADLLSDNVLSAIPTGEKITCFDIGVGASCIYPIIGVSEYNWNFIGSDIDSQSIKYANNITKVNSLLKNKIECRLQENRKDIFYGVIRREEKIDVSICNPPFHSSTKVAQKGARRKVQNLSGKPVHEAELNFSGIKDELICDGGEYKFILNMIRESKKYAKNFYWFTTLVSKKSNLKGIYRSLEKHNAVQFKTIEMATGNKSSRIVAWTFLTEIEQKEWRESRWEI